MNAHMNRPDWDYWQNIPSVLLVDACGLAAGIDLPRYRSMEKLFQRQLSACDDGCGKEYRQQLMSRYHSFLDANEPQIIKVGKIRQLAEENFTEMGGELEMFGIDRLTGHPRVKLAVFGAWAKSVDIELPDEFPPTFSAIPETNSSVIPRDSIQHTTIQPLWEEYAQKNGKDERAFFNFLRKTTPAGIEASENSDELIVEGKRVDFDSFRHWKVFK